MIGRGLLGVGIAAAAAIAAIVWRPALDPIDPPGGFARAQIEQGAKLAAIGDCAICHAGADGRAYAGGRPLQTPFGAIHATNITPDAQTGIGRWSQAAFVRAMREGVDRDGRFLYPAFPYSHFARVTDADLAAIYAFLMTREPVRATAPANRLPFPLDIRATVAFWNLLYLRDGEVPHDDRHDASWKRGAYLAEGLGHCGACHTPHNRLGAEIADRAYAGGEAEGWNGPALTEAASPAPLPWTAGQILAFLTEGVADRHAAAAGPMMPVSHDLSGVDIADVRAIANYIASLAGGPDPARERRAEMLVAASRAAVPPARASAGTAIFAGACAGCHGVGAPMMLNGRPSLALGSSVAAADPRNAIQIVLHGLQPHDGERGAYMPGFEATMTDAQIADVLRALRGRFSDLPAWPDLEAGVARIRARPQM